MTPAKDHKNSRCSTLFAVDAGEQANSNSDGLPHSTHNNCHRSRPSDHVRGPHFAPNAPSMPLHVAAGRCSRSTFVITSQKFSLGVVTVRYDTTRPHHKLLSDPHAGELSRPLLCIYGIEGMLTKICLAYVKLLAYRGAVVSGAARRFGIKEHFPHGYASSSVEARVLAANGETGMLQTFISTPPDQLLSSRPYLRS